MNLNSLWVIAISSVLVIACVTDVLQHKVYNWLTFPAIGLGLGLNAAMQGLPGLWFGILGMLLGALLFMPAFLWGGMGAGDIKLMAAVGSFAGWVVVINIALYTALAGGVMAIVLLGVKGELWRTLKTLGCFMRSVVVPKLQVEPLSKKYAMPYALAIAAGTMAAYFLPPIILL